MDLAMDLEPAENLCATPAEPFCEPQPLPWQADLCGHTPEDFATVALALEPRGAAWCKDFGTVKAALYRGFGKLLSDFEQRMCALFKESLACESVELLSEWEFEYGLPGECAVGAYPTDLAGRQAMVCAARRAQGISTMQQLEDVLKIALDCPHLTLEDFYIHNSVGTFAGMPLTIYGGICVRGIGPLAPLPYIHNVVGGWGMHPAISTGVYGSAAGQPLTLVDPNYTQPEQCPIVYHSTVGGWTGGVGIPLTTADPVKWALLVCLMQKHLPAHVVWQVCVPEAVLVQPPPPPPPPPCMQITSPAQDIVDTVTGVKIGVQVMRSSSCPPDADFDFVQDTVTGTLISWFKNTPGVVDGITFNVAWEDGGGNLIGYLPY